MKTNWKATWFNKEDEWQDEADGHTNDTNAIDRGKQFLSGAKDGDYVIVAKTDNIYRLDRGNVKVKAL